MADHALDIEVDREVMGELLEAREAERGARARQPRVSGRQGSELGVCGREQHELARALSQIDRLRAVEDAARCRREEVHQAPSPRP